MAAAKVDLGVNPILTVGSWLGIISLILVGCNDRILYLYVIVSFLGVLMINSILFKMFKLSSVSYDFIIYHFITSLATAAATLISTLRLAPYHRVSLQHGPLLDTIR